MKTIEERAYRKSLKMLNPNSFARPTTRELLIEMATEQKSIDIDKACEWFSEHMIEYVCYNEMDGWDINHKEMHEDFCKAMED